MTTDIRKLKKKNQKGLTNYLQTTRKQPYLGFANLVSTLRVYKKGCCNVVDFLFAF